MRAALVAALAMIGACDAASSDPGLAAWLRVDGAQFVPGPPPADQGGPSVATVGNTAVRVPASANDNTIRGALAPGAAGVGVALAGDRGYWLIVAGPPNFESPTQPSFSADYAISADAQLGRTQLVLHAFDAAGRAGPERAMPFEIFDEGTPAGTLVVSLVWDTESDLDLHVIDADGVEIWARNINSYQAPPPGEPVDPDLWMSGGILDRDSNANCVIDGKRREDVVWTQTPPSGSYRVRVDPASLCGQPAARWRVSVTQNGAVGAQATGELVEASTRGDHGPGDGLEVLTFEVP